MAVHSKAAGDKAVTPNVVLPKLYSPKQRLNLGFSLTGGISDQLRRHLFFVCRNSFLHYKRTQLGTSKHVVIGHSPTTAILWWHSLLVLKIPRLAAGSTVLKNSLPAFVEVTW